MVKSGKTLQKLAQRGRLILLLAAGMSHSDISRRLQVSRPTVLLWRGRIEREGVPGLLRDAPRPGRKKVIEATVVQRVVDATLHTTPPHAIRWSVRSMAQAQGLSRRSVQRIWKQYGLQPHRQESFKVSRDP